MNDTTKETAWLIADGALGHFRQCEALARALDVSVHRLDLELLPLGRLLAPRAPALWRYQARLTTPLPTQAPDWIIGAGRRAALGVRHLKRQHPTARAVQILYPGFVAAEFDALITPAHDAVAGDRILTVDGALHQVDDQWLTMQSERWAARFATFMQPRIAVLIGGGNHAFALTDDEIRRMFSEVQAWIADRGSLLVTLSPRTPPALAAVVREHVRPDRDFLYDPQEPGDNPYGGLLACADAMVVTPDSINMVSEACGTGQPVFVPELKSAHPRFQRFLDGLRQQDRIRSIGAHLEHWEYPPLREADRVARLLRRS